MLGLSLLSENLSLKVGDDFCQDVFLQWLIPRAQNKEVNPIKAAGSVPAPPLQALTAQSPLVDPCWPHTQAACDAQLLLPLPVPLSSRGRIQPAKQKATREGRSKSAEVSPRFASFPLAEVVCSFYFTSPTRVGKAESCPDRLSTSVQAVGTTSTSHVWNWSWLKTLQSSRAVAAAALMGPGKQRWPGHNRSAHCSTQAVQGQGSARAWRWRCAGSKPGKSPSSHSQGFGKLAGCAEANHQAVPKIQLHILLSSLPSMTERFISTLRRRKHFSLSPAQTGTSGSLFLWQMWLMPVTLGCVMSSSGLSVYLFFRHNSHLSFYHSTSEKQ